MISNTVILIPLHAPLDWITDYQLQTIKILAAHDNRVIVFKWGSSKSVRNILTEFLIGKGRISVLKKEKNIIYYSPIHLFPFRRLEIIKNFNLALNIIFIKLFLFFFERNRRRILWLFSPPEFYFIPKLLGRSFYSIYDCVDYYSLLDKKISQRNKKREISIANTVDKVFVNSRSLFSYFRKIRKDVALVPQGFALEIFRKFQKTEINKLRLPKGKPIIGLVGGINNRIDFPLLFELINKCPEYNFVFIGPKQRSYSDDEKYLQEKNNYEKLFSLTNTFWIDKQAKSKIPSIIKNFDAAMIPYDTALDFNKYCHPMKLFEYFYLGKPMIATPIEELKRFPKFVKIGRNADEWKIIIEKLLSKPWPEKYKIQQKKLAIENSWENKIEAISKVIEKKYTIPS